MDPKNTFAFYNRGNSKTDLGSYSEAIKDFTKSIALKPDYARAYFNRAIAKQHINDKAGACSDFRKAEKLGYSKAKEEIKKNCQ